MKAGVWDRYGPPEVVRVGELDKPVPGDGELLVKVHATTVNRTDCGVRAAKPFLYRLFVGLRRPRLAVLGNEFAGEVEAVGGGVGSFRPGDRVLGVSPNRVGAHAEYLAVPEHRPVIDRHYPLDQIVEAYRYVETGQKLGNVVITVR